MSIFNLPLVSILTDFGKISTNISVWYVKTLLASKNDPNKVGKDNFWKDIVIVHARRKVCELRLMLLWFNKWLEGELNVFQIIKMFSVHLSCCSKLTSLYWAQDCFLSLKSISSSFSRSVLRLLCSVLESGTSSGSFMTYFLEFVLTGKKASGACLETKSPLVDVWQGAKLRTCFQIWG